MFVVLLWRTWWWTVTLVARRSTIIAREKIEKLPQSVAFFSTLLRKFHAFRYFVVMFNLISLYVKVHLKIQQ